VYYSVDIYRDDNAARPSITMDSVDAALFHIQAASMLSNLDVEDVQLVVYDSEDNPIWRLKILSIVEEAEVVDLEERRRGV
jgi:hypothetical protein